MTISGFFSNEIKSQVQELLQRQHETWGKNIVMWKEPQRTVIASTSEYVGVYGDGQTSDEQVTFTPVSGVFKARIYYPDLLSNSKSPLTIQNSTTTKIDENSIRIKLENSGYAFLKDSKKVTIDGVDCEIISTDRIHGMFDQIYHTVWLTKIK